MEEPTGRLPAVGRHPVRPVAEQPEAAAVVVLDAVVVAKGGTMLAGGRLPSGRGRHHSSATRSGPSARTMRWACWRQWKTEGGSSGTWAMTSTGSGRCSSRVGRAPFIPATRFQAPADAGLAAAPVVCTRSGRWLSRGSRRTTFSGPNRNARRSARSMVPSSPSDAAIAPASGRASCVPSQASTSGAARIISSTPKPGSSSPSFSSKSFISLGLSRLGRLVPMAVRSTEPSTR